MRSNAMPYQGHAEALREEGLRQRHLHQPPFGQCREAPIGVEHTAVEPDRLFATTVEAEPGSDMLGVSSLVGGQTHCGRAPCLTPAMGFRILDPTATY